MKTLNVNGQPVEVDAQDSTPLLWVLREHLGLTGTKYGCGIAQCGSCTVHLDGVAVRSCVMPLAAVSETTKVTTIEGLSADGSHPVQQAWAELDVPQCGYCQPGMIMAVSGMLNASPDADDAAFRGMHDALQYGRWHRRVWNTTSSRTPRCCCRAIRDSGDQLARCGCDRLSNRQGGRVRQLTRRAAAQE